MSNKARAIIATAKISASREARDGISDEENVPAAGFRDMDEYWRAALSGPMRISTFVDLLATHVVGPLKDGGNEYRWDLRDEVIGAADKFTDGARDSRVPYDGQKIRPRHCGVSSQLPTLRHLVPKTLVDFIERKEAETIVVSAEPVMHKRQGKHKRRSPVTNKVIVAMKLCERNKLESMLEKDMEAKFGASRDTCRKARDIVLSVNVDRQDSTNDK